MMFLIMKMFVYLFLAGTIGAAAGWLLRNLQAQKTDEAARRTVHDAKSKVPQLESLLRGRDEQIAKLKDDIKAQRVEMKEAVEATQTVAAELLEQKRETTKWKESAEAGTSLSIDGNDDGNTDEIIAELAQEITQLKCELEQAQSSPIETNHEPVVAASSDRLEDFAEKEALILAELDASRLQNRQLERTLCTAKEDLERQQRTLSELERERALQNKSLQVLHQQLELERSNQRASI